VTQNSNTKIEAVSRKSTELGLEGHRKNDRKI
jgi:hypothetical protein